MAALGALYVLIFLGLMIGIPLYVARKYGPRIIAKKRDRQIEMAMRMGLRDAEAQQRIAGKIITERLQNGHYDN